MKLLILAILSVFSTHIHADNSYEKLCEKETIKCEQNFVDVDSFLKKSSEILFCNEMSSHLTIFREHMKQGKELEISNRGEPGLTTQKAANRPLLVALYKDRIVKFDLDSTAIDRSDYCPSSLTHYQKVAGDLYVNSNQKGARNLFNSAESLFVYKKEHTQNEYIIVINSQVSYKDPYSKMNGKTVAQISSAQRTMECVSKKQSDYLIERSNYIASVKKNCPLQYNIK